MGGFGSGHWYRLRTHSTVIELPELRAIDFKNPCGEIDATPRDEFNRSKMSFRYIRSGRAVILFPSEVSECTGNDTLTPILHVVSTACNFGGKRHWLLCPVPNCGRRVQSLFIKEHHTIACRKCLGLLYESQYGGGIEKQMTRLRAMHRKILRGGMNKIAVVHQTQQQFQSLIDDLRKIDRAEW